MMKCNQYETFDHFPSIKYQIQNTYYINTKIVKKKNVSLYIIYDVPCLQAKMIFFQITCT